VKKPRNILPCPQLHLGNFVTALLVTLFLSALPRVQVQPLTAKFARE
jgi:hypothetical protein